MKKTVIKYLDNTVKKYAGKIACIDDDEQITYKELDRLSTIVALNLNSKITLHAPIPLIMKKSCRALVLLWGIVKSGACYVVIDANQPAVRIESILQTLNTDIVISDLNLSKKVPSFNGFALTYNDLTDDSVICDMSDAEIQKKLSEITKTIIDTDPLYIMFTSGSTGIPKGVLVNHKSVLDFIDCFTKLFKFSDTDIIGNQAPWDFDVSVKDIFSAAKCGATLRLIPKKYFSLPMELCELLERDKVTVLTWAVSALVILSSRGILDKLAPSSIKKIIFSGEVMPVKQYNIWRSKYPNAMIVNIYGPTEITCNCTYHFINGLQDESSPLPMGKAIPNERVFLLDDGDQLIGENETFKPGEVCVTGTCVSMGYYNNPAETAKRFVMNPLNSLYEERIYRTGDLAFYNENKDLVFASRKDFQIKHMGHRIELSEIERAINSTESVHMSCCLYENEEIIAVVEGSTEEKEIVSNIRKTLPSFMIPTKFIFVPSMPFNNNGKIDRKKLKEDIFNMQ